MLARSGPIRALFVGSLLDFGLIKYIPLKLNTLIKMHALKLFNLKDTLKSCGTLGHTLQARIQGGGERWGARPPWPLQSFPE